MENVSIERVFAMVFLIVLTKLMNQQTFANIQQHQHPKRLRQPQNLLKVCLYSLRSDQFDELFSSVFKFIINLSSLFTQFTIDLLRISHSTNRVRQRSRDIVYRSDYISKDNFNSINSILSNEFSSHGSDCDHNRTTRKCQCSYW